MDDVADILSGQYGIHQPGKLTPMAASKSPNSGISFVPRDGVLAEKTLLSSPKRDSVLEILGMRLAKREGIGFDELVNGASAPGDPFLVFEADFLSSNQLSGKTNVSSSAYVDGSDFFDISGGIGRSTSSFPSERNGNIGKIRTPGVDQNPRNTQNPLKDSLIDLNPSSSAPKPPILANSDFFGMYDTATDEKETSVTASRDEKNKSYNGIEAFFSGIGLGGSWPPSQMEETSENVFDAPFETQGSLGGAQKVSTVSNFNINEPSFMKSSIDDLSFEIGAFQSHSKFQDIEGDNEHRRWARYEREKRKFERAAKALAEKNELDLELQRERNEREMIAEELDIEVKQWAAGREGNLRALLSTLQDVLWPECGWQPISLSNLMTSTAVKKAYGKAALCIHPDKVQQKGSTLRQKYVAEKVFYLLTQALNKFNSKELT